MTFPNFSDLMLKLGWRNEQMVDLFQAFRSKTTGNEKYLSYPELISGLAACEPCTPHGDLSGEARCRYIFRLL